MKFRVRYSLRTLFIVVTVAAIVAGGFVWRQLEWIRLRHEFLNAHNDAVRAAQLDTPYVKYPNAPYPLGLFGEAPRRILLVLPQYVEEAKRLFPEAQVIDKSSLPQPHDIMF